MRPPIHNTFAPLANRAQIRLALALQVQPWRYVKGHEVEMLRSTLEQHFSRQCSLFASGRQALLASLQTMNIQPGDEVIVQGYTCTVVPNAISTLGAIPVYCDIEPDTLNLDLNSVRKKISPNTKAIICQHTFGIPAKVQELKTLCEQKGILLIEDCAHSIPTPLSEVGSTGDIVILSFGRDKAVSGVAGGAALAKDANFSASLQRKEEHASHMPWSQIAKLLAYPLRYQAAKWHWRFHLGLLYLKILQIFKGLPAIYTSKERQGLMAKQLQKLPNGCAILALQQCKQLSAFNEHRNALKKFYLKELTTNAIHVVPGIKQSTEPQKFPILVPNRSAVLQHLRKQGIYLQDGWSGAVINPPSIKPSVVFYSEGATPEAERISKSIINLPLHPTTSKKQAKRVVACLRKALSEQPYQATAAEAA